ncbi:2,3-bisphosphoglycerate-dependent phosphoglycerate mutase [Scopulibacillus darangshiensis]|uniref:2,3-bisphosphoglycerate-dependent phosphoglycerate mutase n=1 Tax=Scopulibacillus darangshiensis TaxID=442528 RepID=A0A4R2P3U9_9BACL|nr:histidine phosphatase family protein [Scopulibacillus darangshiensis]TCP29383.1 2,3-bisphosphoglycerate-dependent phosphoglycerate mutase [Scopulibacillus darangshiensis]
MSTNLYFVRHAHSTYTPDELGRPLSEKGFQDANRVTKLLSYKHIDHVISSPYLRARQTVEGLADSVGKDIKIIEGFKERKLQDGSAGNFEEAVKKVWSDYSFAWEGGESNLEAQKRGIVATEWVLKQFKGSNVAIGTHGNIMVLIMNYYEKQYDYEFWKQLAMPDIYKLSFDGDKLIGCKKIWNHQR